MRKAGERQADRDNGMPICMDGQVRVPYVGRHRSEGQTRSQMAKKEPGKARQGSQERRIALHDKPGARDGT